jgi:hypothetical protein
MSFLSSSSSKSSGSVLTLFASYCSSSQTIISSKPLYRALSISKVALKVLLATDDEVELLPGHGGVDDEGRCIIIVLGFYICFQLSSSYYYYFFDLIIDSLVYSQFVKRFVYQSLRDFLFFVHNNVLTM